MRWWSSWTPPPFRLCSLSSKCTICPSLCMLGLRHSLLSLCNFCPAELGVNLGPAAYPEFHVWHPSSERIVKARCAIKKVINCIHKHCLLPPVRFLSLHCQVTGLTLFPACPAPFIWLYCFRKAFGNLANFMLELIKWGLTLFDNFNKPLFKSHSLQGRNESFISHKVSILNMSPEFRSISPLKCNWLTDSIELSLKLQESCHWLSTARQHLHILNILCEPSNAFWNNLANSIYCPLIKVNKMNKTLDCPHMYLHTNSL